MPSYADLYNQQKQEDATNSLVAAFVTWEKPGQTVLGELVGIETYRGKYEQPINQYRIKTDTGLVSVICGQIADRAISKDLLGSGIRIEYKGQVKLVNGRTANDFDIETFDLGQFKSKIDTSVPGPIDEPPF